MLLPFYSNRAYHDIALLCIANLTDYHFYFLELMCASDPCQNGATCDEVDPGDLYTCTCTAQFTGTNCEIRNETLLLNFSDFTVYL